MSLIHFLQQNPWTFYGFCLLLGAAVGSFLNVVVYRLPKMLEREWRSQCNELLEIEQGSSPEKPLTLSTPGSSCPGCGHRIKVYENIPIISYLLLKGHCSSCSTSISLRYPLVESFTILLTLLVAFKFGVSIQTLTALPLVWSLIALSLIDFDHKLLPDNIVLPALWAGLLINLRMSLSGRHADHLGTKDGRGSDVALAAPRFTSPDLSARIGKVRIGCDHGHRHPGRFNLPAHSTPLVRIVVFDEQNAEVNSIQRELGRFTSPLANGHGSAHDLSKV